MKTDSELIARHCSFQDKAAFAELVTRYQSSIRQFLRRLTAGDHHLADDIAQETFLIMFRKINTFSGTSTLSTWLHKVAYNCFLKSIKTHEKFQFDDDFDIETIASIETDLLSDILLEKLMLNLSIDERLTLTLNFAAGMSHSEIVSITKIPLGTVKSHINRAKNKLSKLLLPAEKIEEVA